MLHWIVFLLLAVVVFVFSTLEIREEKRQDEEDGDCD